MRLVFIIAIIFLLIGCNQNKTDDKIKFLNLNMVSNTISQKGDSLIYSAWDTTVNIYSITQKRRLFSKRTIDICYAKPVIKSNMIYFPLANEKFVCLNLNTDKLNWQLNLKRRCSNFDFVDDSTIVLSDKSRGLIGVDSKTGEILYELKYDFTTTKLPDLSPWQVSFDEKNFYVSNWQGSLLTCVDKKNGRIKWSFNDNQSGIASKSIIYGESIFFGTNIFYKTGRVYLLNTLDGRILYGAPCKYEERLHAVKYNDNIYFYSFDSWLNKFDLINKKITRILKFKDKHNLSGGQLYQVKDKLFFSDTSFYINMFSMTDNNLSQLQEHERNIAWVYSINDKTYFVY